MNVNEEKTEGGPPGQGMYPLLFEPVYKAYVWGGRRIPEVFGREAPDDVCAESWEVSDRPEGMSIVRNGRYAGRSLQELVLTMGEELIGPAAKDVFPLLVKLIDARERLSVQVHPNDRTAARTGGEPKTEMWYVLDAAPGATLFAGLARGVNRKKLEAALDAQRLEEVLQPIPAERGTTLFIPGGRVHAIGEGCLLLEVQQNSNTTYRVYDWGRVGRDGAPRELHREKAFQCINWRDRAAAAAVPVRCERIGPNPWWRLSTCPYFDVLRGEINGPDALPDAAPGFDILFVLNGRIRVDTEGGSETIGFGDACLLPACLASRRLTPLSGSAEVIRIRPGSGR